MKAIRSDLAPLAVGSAPAAGLTDALSSAAGYALNEKADTTRRHHTTFYIFDPTDPGDVIDYWNYRLIERHVIPINVGWFSYKTCTYVRSLFVTHVRVLFAIATEMPPLRR